MSHLIEKLEAHYNKLAEAHYNRLHEEDKKKLSTSQRLAGGAAVLAGGYAGAKIGKRAGQYAGAFKGAPAVVKAANAQKRAIAAVGARGAALPTLNSLCARQNQIHSAIKGGKIGKVAGIAAGALGAGALAKKLFDKHNNK